MVKENSSPPEKEVPQESAYDAGQRACQALGLVAPDKPNTVYKDED